MERVLYKTIEVMSLCESDRSVDRVFTDAQEKSIKPWKKWELNTDLVSKYYWRNLCIILEPNNSNTYGLVLSLTLFLFSSLDPLRYHPPIEYIRGFESIFLLTLLQEMDDEEGYFSVSMENTERDEVIKKPILLHFISLVMVWFCRIPQFAMFVW